MLDHLRMMQTLTRLAAQLAGCSCFQHISAACL